MNTKWRKLNNPPVVAAVFQIKYEKGSIKLDDFLKYDQIIRKSLKLRTDTLQSTLTVPKSTTLGVGKVDVKGIQETRNTGFTYFSSNQKKKLTITEEDITFVSEEEYNGWDAFKADFLRYIETFTPSLESVTIQRTSIRFVNQFTLSSFDDPSEYFNTVISSNTEDSIPYPLIKYGYSLTLDVAEGVYSIINHNVNNVTDKFVCIFDIDVLDKNNLIFDLPSINEVLERLRTIKNKIFFNNITDKTLNLSD